MRRALVIGLGVVALAAALALFAHWRRGAPLERIDDASHTELERILREEGER